MLSIKDITSNKIIKKKKAPQQKKPLSTYFNTFKTFSYQNLDPIV